MKFNLIILLFFSFQSTLVGELENIALNKPCIFDPQPTYVYTKDALDYKQLTDGVKEESLWYSRYRDKTVGWFPFSQSVHITIDLEQKENIESVNIYTVGGGGRGGMEYPEYIIGMASNDGISYSFVSLFEADKSGWVFGDPNHVKLREPKIATLRYNVRCRFVKLLIRPFGNCFFSDEIEIMRSEKDQSYDLGSYLSYDEAFDYVERIRQLGRNTIVLNNALTDLGEVALSDRLKNIQLELYNLKSSFFNLKKLDKLSVNFNLLRSDFLRFRNKVSWHAYTTDVMKLLRFEDLPEVNTEEQKVYFYVWHNENSLAAFNIVNTSNQPLVFILNTSPISSGNKFIKSDQIIKLRRAIYVYSRNTGFFADPLVLQNNKPFTVKPGETTQICLEIDSAGLEAGKYSAAVAIVTEDCGDKPNQVLPISIDVADKEFSHVNSFMACNWDYIKGSAAFTRSIVDEAVNDLKSHHINVTVMHPVWIFKINSSAKDYFDKVTINPELGNELKLRTHAKFILLHLGLGPGRENYFGNDMYSDGWESNFSRYIRKLSVYMKLQGYNYDDYAIYPYDESVEDSFIRVAQVIRRTDPNIQIYANSIGTITDTVNIKGEKYIQKALNKIQKVKELIDIWAPPIEYLENYNQILEAVKKSDCKIWSYGGSSKLSYTLSKFNVNIKPKRGFYRLSPIKAVALGINGAGFWSYTEYADDSSFNQIDARGYGVVYDGKDSGFPSDAIFEAIVPSKRWQLWREGVEDAICLQGHDDLLQEFMNKPAEELTSEYLTSLRKKADGVSE